MEHTRDPGTREDEARGLFLNLGPSVLLNQFKANLENKKIK